MRYIFLDESGELGFKQESSKFFVITLLSCDDRAEVDIGRILKKVRLKILKKKFRKTPELKGNNASDQIRREVLTRLAKINCEIFAIVLDKSKVFDYLKDKKHKLYNYVSNVVLNECNLGSGKIMLIVDRSKNRRSLRDDFDNYIRNVLIKKSGGCEIEIKHRDSASEGGLQVVDFVSWAIFRKYESLDESFYGIIKSKIVTEKLMFKFTGP